MWAAAAIFVFLSLFIYFFSICFVVNIPLPFVNTIHSVFMVTLLNLDIIIPGVTDVKTTTIFRWQEVRFVTITIKSWATLNYIVQVVSGSVSNQADVHISPPACLSHGMLRAKRASSVLQLRHSPQVALPSLMKAFQVVFILFVTKLSRHWINVTNSSFPVTL